MSVDFKEKIVNDLPLYERMTTLCVPIKVEDYPEILEFAFNHIFCCPDFPREVSIDHEFSLIDDLYFLKKDRVFSKRGNPRFILHPERVKWMGVSIENLNNIIKVKLFTTQERFPTTFSEFAGQEEKMMFDGRFVLEITLYHNFNLHKITYGINKSNYLKDPTCNISLENGECRIIPSGLSTKSAR